MSEVKWKKKGLFFVYQLFGTIRKISIKYSIKYDIKNVSYVGDTLPNVMQRIFNQLIYYCLPNVDTLRDENSYFFVIILFLHLFAVKLKLIRPRSF